MSRLETLSRASVSLQSPPEGCCETAAAGREGFFCRCYCYSFFFFSLSFFLRGFCGIWRWEAGSGRRSTTWDEATRTHIRGWFQWVLWLWRGGISDCRKRAVGNIFRITRLWTLCCLETAKTFFLECELGTQESKSRSIRHIWGRLHCNKCIITTLYRQKRKTEPLSLVSSTAGLGDEWGWVEQPGGVVINM